MTKREQERVILGEGDEEVEGWIGPAADKIETLEKYMERIGNGDFEVNWAKVLSGIKGFESKGAKAIRLDDEYDLLKFLDRISGINVDFEAWGGDAPGRGGNWIQVWIYAGDESKITRTLEQVLERLQNLYPLV